MKICYSILFLAFTFVLGCQAQQPADRPQCKDETFDKAVATLLSYTVPLKSVEDLSKEDLSNYTILDAREQKEFNTSHIQGAICVGYNNFDIQQLKDIDKNKPIVVYCSVGYRSEKIGEKLIQSGYTKVYNLFGSIFEWINQGNEIEKSSGNTTLEIHTYNQKWSRWVLNKKYKKVW